MFKTSKSALAAALSFSGDVIERRNTIPVLANVLIERSESGLLARMTDLDIELTVPFNAQADDTFQPFTVPAHLLRDIVRKLPDGADIHIEAPGAKLDSVTLKSGRSRFSLQVLPAHDFPTLGGGHYTAHLAIDAKAFAAALSAVKFAISTEETRYYLNGIYMHAAETGIILVATDGHRLAKRFVSLSETPPELPGVIIPRKTVATLEKILPKDGVISLDVSDQKIHLTAGGTRLVSKLIDGTFPDYQRVVPQNNSMVAEFVSAELSAAVDRVSSVSTERGRAARFRLSQGTLTLSVNNPDFGEAEDALSYEGEADIETGFNSKYVLEAISHLPEGTVTLHLDQPGSPAILRADGDHTENLIVLMPMRV